MDNLRSLFSEINWEKKTTTLHNPAALYGEKKYYFIFIFLTLLILTNKYINGFLLERYVLSVSAHKICTQNI